MNLSLTADSENLIMACFFSSRLPKMVGYPFWAYVALAILTAKKCLRTDVVVLN
jgi:hypothetical protein